MMISSSLTPLLFGGFVSASTWQVATCFAPISTSTTPSLRLPFVRNNPPFSSSNIARKSTKHDEGVGPDPFSGALEQIPSLASLPLIPYIDDRGLITRSEAGGEDDTNKSSCVFAIFDQDKEVQYVGATDHLHHMLKVMLARRPDKTYYYKAYHVSKPSRSFIDLVMGFWLAEGETFPHGNSGGDEEELWEKPLDVKPLFTDQDYADIEELEKQGHMSKDMAMKVVTWQFEEEKMEVLRSRGVTEDLHFDLNLKGDGQLDLKAEGLEGTHLEP